MENCGTTFRFFYIENLFDAELRCQYVRLCRLLIKYAKTSENQANQY